MKKFLAVALLASVIGLTACEAVDHDVDYSYEQAAPYNADEDRTVGEKIFDNAQRK